MILRRIRKRINSNFQGNYDLYLIESEDVKLFNKEKYITLIIIYGIVNIYLDSRSIKLVSGNIILLKKGDKIEYKLHGENSKICVVNFKKEFFDTHLKSQMADCPILYDFLRLDAKKIEYLVFDITTYEVVKGYLDFLLYEMSSSNEKNEKLVKAALILFLTNLHNIHKESLNISESSMMKYYDIGRWLGYMAENYSTVTLSTMAKEFNFNPTYFSLRFKELAKCNFSDKLREIKLEKAKWLLITTDLSVQSISEMIGFKEKSYFYRAFKNRFGMTPLQYRKYNNELRI